MRLLTYRLHRKTSTFGPLPNKFYMGALSVDRLVSCLFIIQNKYFMTPETIPIKYGNE